MLYITVQVKSFRGRTWLTIREFDNINCDIDAVIKWASSLCCIYRVQRNGKTVVEKL